MLTIHSQWNTHHLPLGATLLKCFLQERFVIFISQPDVSIICLSALWSPCICQFTTGSLHISSCALGLVTVSITVWKTETSFAILACMQVRGVGWGFWSLCNMLDWCNECGLHGGTRLPSEGKKPKWLFKKNRGKEFSLKIKTRERQTSSC